jgi:L-ascorbate metabolism protein UlaG (beta-lactamase superfamily)
MCSIWLGRGLVEPDSLALDLVMVRLAGVPHVTTCLCKQPCVLFIAFIPPVDAILVTH